MAGYIVGAQKNGMKEREGETCSFRDEPQHRPSYLCPCSHNIPFPLFSPRITREDQLNREQKEPVTKALRKDFQFTTREVVFIFLPRN